MDFTVIETDKFNALLNKIDSFFTITKTLAEENKKLKDNRLMSISDVCEYTGFAYKWVFARKEDIGYFQDGKDLRFYKEDVDKYIKENFIKRKFK